MAELRFQWGDLAPQTSPASPEGTSASLWVGEHVVWQGDVTEELRAWARWCALQVADLWGCTEIVRGYLETGVAPPRDATVASLISAAQAAVAEIQWDAATEDAWNSAWDGLWDTAWAGSWDAAWNAAWDVTWEGVTPGEALRAEDIARCAASAAARAAWDAAPQATRDTARATTRQTIEDAQATRLRRLLLQRALPEHHWPLIDGNEGAESGPAESGRVLCDALLESAGGREPIREVEGTERGRGG